MFTQIMAILIRLMGAEFEDINIDKTTVRKNVASPEPELDSNSRTPVKKITL